MNDRASCMSAGTFVALYRFQQANPLAGTLDAIVDEAVKQWLARQADVRGGIRSGGQHADVLDLDEQHAGYRWKQLLLPPGTQLRIEAAGESYSAKVCGNALIFRGERVSPRQMLMELTGLSGNAWRRCWIRRPGDRYFAQACALRSRLQREAVAEAPPSGVSAFEHRMARALERLEKLTVDRRSAMPRRLRAFAAHDPDAEFRLDDI